MFFGIINPIILATVDSDQFIANCLKYLNFGIHNSCSTMSVQVMLQIKVSSEINADRKLKLCDSLTGRYRELAL